MWLVSACGLEAGFGNIAAAMALPPYTRTCHRTRTRSCDPMITSAPKTTSPALVSHSMFEPVAASALTVSRDWL
jgi:hypothetical protein